MEYPIQSTYVDNPDGLAVGQVDFVTAEFYHEELAHLFSHGLDEVFDIVPLQPIPEDY